MPDLVFTVHALEKLEERKLRKPYVYWAWHHSKEVSVSWDQRCLLFLKYGNCLDHLKYFWGLGIMFVVDVIDAEKPVLVTLYAHEDKKLKFVS